MKSINNFYLIHKVASQKMTINFKYIIFDEKVVDNMVNGYYILDLEPNFSFCIHPLIKNLINGIMMMKE